MECVQAGRLAGLFSALGAPGWGAQEAGAGGVAVAVPHPESLGCSPPPGYQGLCPLWFRGGCVGALSQPLYSERGQVCGGGWCLLSPPSPGFSVLARERAGAGSGLGGDFGALLPLAAWEATRIHLVLNGFPSISSVDPPSPASIN